MMTIGTLARKMGRSNMRIWTDADYLFALEMTGGNVKEAAALLMCSPMSIYQRRHKSKEFKQKHEQIKQRAL